MERQNFEDSWKKAFEKAEVAPSGNVWTNIELDLERANGGKLKKRLVFFQLLAAASVVFLLGIGAGMFIMKDSYDESLRELTLLKASNAKLITAVNNAARQNQLAAEQINAAKESKNTLTASNDKTSTIISAHTNAIAKNENNASDNDAAGQLLLPDDTDQNNMSVFGPYRTGALAFVAPASLPPIVEQRKIQLPVTVGKSNEDVDPVLLMMARLEQRERQVRAAEEGRQKKTRQSEQLWTSVGFAAGSFNATNSGGTNSNRQQSLAFAQNSSIANNEAKASGTSYSIGANIGTKLSERWVFQGGVNYLTQSTDYSTQSAVAASDDFRSFRPATINELDKISSSEMAPAEKLVTTAPYNVNNNLRYLSIPMQAGYMLINKDFGLQFNAGVATDVFLQNTVSAQGGGLDKSSQSIGEDSPYRSVNLSGLAGTELSYRFSKNYRVALNPGVRYPFNSIYRSELAVRSNPITFDIGLRFRYIFR